MQLNQIQSAMKKTKIISTVAAILILSGIESFSQIPQGFTYQAVARNAQGNLIANTAVQVKIGILTDTVANVYVWEEQHNLTTTSQGLLTLIVGSGTKLQGSANTFADINWVSVPLYLRTLINYQGNWKNMGTTRIWSTPYSIVSGVSGKADALTPGAKISVVSSNDAATDPLFEVKRKDGQPVFQVYSDAVNVFVPNGTKGSKGGFAIGGFNETKAYSQDFLRVTSDSVRVYINDNPSAKGSKGGFAIGGFNETKAGPSLVRNYFMNVTGATNMDTVKGSPQILWFPNKNAFFAGNVQILSADSVGKYSTALGYRSKAMGDYSQAFGYKAFALGDYSTSIGKNSLAGARTGTGHGTSTASNAFAFGNGTRAIGEDSYALGSGAVASGYRSFAFGSVGLNDSGNPTSTPTTANNSYTFAMGMGAQATQKGAMALGIGSLASGYYSNSFGYYSTSSGYYSTALGFKSTASNYYAGSLGYFANASGQGSLAMGYSATASGNYSSAIGAQSQAVNTYASSFGRAAVANGQNSVAVGYGATTGSSATDATAVGKSASATGANSMALGVSASASGSTSVSIGYTSTATNSYSTAMGYNAQSSGQYAIALGYQAVTSGNYSASLGSGAQATNSNALALGNGSVASGTNSTAIGYQSQAQSDKSIAIGSYYSYSYLIPIISLSKGPEDEGTKGIDDLLPIRPITPISTFTRSFSRANIATGQYSVAVGNGNLAQAGGLVFGSNSDAIKFGALALGTSAAAKEANSVAMGYNTTANGIYSMAIGNNVTANSYGEISLGQWNESVSGTFDTWNENDLLFTVGNGVNTDNRSNALTIYKNGKSILRGRYAVSTFNYKVRRITFPSFILKDYIYGIYTLLNRDDTNIEYYYSGWFGDTGTSGIYYGLYADERSGGSIDVAEYIYDTRNNTEPADVVVADIGNKESVLKSSSPYQTGVVGVISTKPHMTMGMELVVDEKTGEPIPDAKPAARLALTGRVPVKICGENGAVQPGDYLTTSSIEGVAMKWSLLDVNSAKDFNELKSILSENEKRRNAIIGKALESFSGPGTGKIVVLISLQ